MYHILLNIVFILFCDVLLGVDQSSQDTSTFIIKMFPVFTLTRPHMFSSNKKLLLTTYTKMILFYCIFQNIVINATTSFKG
jgi:hypothetical protein